MKEFVVRTPKQLGPVLQGYRKARPLTQAAIGQAVGLPQSEISRLELDASSASLGRVFKLLAALDLELVIRSREKNPSRSEW
jgi:HTH-type transcriptional regulator / antitoxin HipB